MNYDMSFCHVSEYETKPQLVILLARVTKAFACDGTCTHYVHINRVSGWNLLGVVRTQR